MLHLKRLDNQNMSYKSPHCLLIMNYSRMLSWQYNRQTHRHTTEDLSTITVRPSHLPLVLCECLFCHVTYWTTCCNLLIFFYFNSLFPRQSVCLSVNTFIFWQTLTCIRTFLWYKPTTLTYQKTHTCTHSLAPFNQLAVTVW